MLRVQLVHSTLGTFMDGNQDPKGINEITQTIKRSAETDGMTYEIILEMSFIKKYRRLIAEAFFNYGGVDASMLTNVYSLNPNTRKWSLYAENKINYARFELAEDMVTTNLEQVGFQRNVLNLIDREIDLETQLSANGLPLPPQTVREIEYHSKVIYKTTDALPSTVAEMLEFQQEDVFKFEVPGAPTPPIPPPSYDRDRMIYGNVATGQLEQAELKDFFQLPWGWSDFGFGMGVYVHQTHADVKAWLQLAPNKLTRFSCYKATEGGVIDLEVVLKLKHEIIAYNSGDIDVCGDAALGNIEIYYWVEIRDASGNIVYLENIGSWDMSHPCVDDVVGAIEEHSHSLLGYTIGVGYEFFVYSTTRIWGDYTNTDAGSDSVTHTFRVTPYEGTRIKITNATVTPSTSARTIMIYEAFERLCQYMTGQLDCFRSTLLGRTDRGYVADGDYALIGLTTGNNLRGRPKPIFFSLQDLLDFINAVACVGFGFDKLSDGKWILVLERKEYFYNKNIVALDLGAVANVKRTVDMKRLYNKVDYGYETKVDVGQINAVDEVNTKRSHALSVVNTKNALKISTKVVTGGYQIEAARRLSTTTEDGKLDDANFAIVMIRDSFVIFKPKRNEGYTLVENVLSPETAYNLDLSPARILRNWYAVIASSMRYATVKQLTFLSGEVNYTMRTQKAGESFIVDEQGTVDLSSVVPLFTGMKLTFDPCALSRDQLKFIKANVYGVIKFKDIFGGNFQGFISSDAGIEHDDSKGTASFELIEAFT